MKNPTTRATSRVAAVAAALLAATACSHRSVANIGGTLAIPEGVTTVRLEVDNGTLDIGTEDPANPSQDIVYKGGLRRDAGSEEQLKQLEAVAEELRAQLDPEQPTRLIVRGPEVPAGVTGMIAVEAGIRIPAGLKVEVVVRQNGHVTVVGRRADIEVRTRRGDLRFEDCHGAVDASTGQGVLIAYDHRGDLDVRSDNGDMQAFMSELGDVLNLGSGKGTVQCHLPADSGFEVDARVETGRIGSDFGLEPVKVGDYSAKLVGRHGSGRTKVVLRTVSGHIALRQRR